MNHVGGGTGDVQVGGRLILLICESCQRPLEDASVSGRVTHSSSAHAWGGGFKFRVGEGGGGGVVCVSPTGSMCFMRSHHGSGLGNQLR